MEILEGIGDAYIVYFTKRKEFWFNDSGPRIYWFCKNEEEQMAKTIQPYIDVNKTECELAPFNIFVTLQLLGLLNAKEWFKK